MNHPLLFIGNRINNYEIVKIISEAEGSCICAVNKIGTQEKYAIKFSINKEQANREISIMKLINSPYIIKIIDSFEFEQYVCIVMPLMDGNVTSLFKKSSGIDESTVRNTIFVVLKALKYLHRANIWHRDIKMENFFLYNTDTKNQGVILGDLGFAIVVKNNDWKSSDYVGTLRFAAPEIINNTTYNQSIDIWSLGVTMYTMLSGTYPFPIAPESCLRRCISKGAYYYPQRNWKNISKSAKNLIDSMIRVNPNERITPEIALFHPWILGHQISTDVMKSSMSLSSLNNI